jgi:hypothetical protein
MKNVIINNAATTEIHKDLAKNISQIRKVTVNLLITGPISKPK